MASSDLVKAKIASLGMSLLQPKAGLAALERLLTAPALTGASLTGLQLATSVQAAIDVVPFRWRRMLQRYEPLPALFQVVADELAGSCVSTSTARVVAGRAVSRPARQPAVVESAPAADSQRLLAAVRAAVQDVLGREVRSVVCFWCHQQLVAMPWFSSTGAPAGRCSWHDGVQRSVVVSLDASLLQPSCLLAAGVS